MLGADARVVEAAWASVLALWELRPVPFAYAAVSSALDGSVGMVCRALLTPLDGRTQAGRPPAVGSRPAG